jgi:hypothetical protein
MSPFSNHLIGENKMNLHERARKIFKEMTQNHCSCGALPNCAPDCNRERRLEEAWELAIEEHLEPNWDKVVR